MRPSPYSPAYWKIVAVVLAAVIVAGMLGWL